MMLDTIRATLFRPSFIFRTSSHKIIMTRLSFFSLIILILVSACSNNQPVAVVTIPVTQIGAGAPIYTATASLTPSKTPTATASNTATHTATITPTLTDTATATLTLTPTNTPSSTPTQTASPTPTTELLPPTAIRLDSAPPAIDISLPELSETSDWSCGDFPCEDDIAGFLERIRVPQGFEISHAGQFDGQVMQITIGNDDRLYATVLENGTSSGAVYVMNADGRSERYSETIVSPNGLAFQPGTDVLYVSGRISIEAGGALFRVDAGGSTSIIIDDLPCCYQIVRNQANGITFGADGLLYMGIGAITDHAESSRPANQPFADILPFEATILRINPHTAEVMAYAPGLHNPYDIAFDSRGRLFATDAGLVTGEGDRILEIFEGAHYGWPFYRTRGCGECPPRPGTLEVESDLLTLPDYSIPQGITVYTDNQFPENMQDALFVALWNGTEWAQRVIWIDPDDVRLQSDEYQAQVFVSGLIRPSDVIVDGDGSLLIADFTYGHVWRVSYTGNGTLSLPEATSSGGFLFPTNTPQA